MGHCFLFPCYFCIFSNLLLLLWKLWRLMLIINVYDMYMYMNLESSGKMKFLESLINCLDYAEVGTFAHCGWCNFPALECWLCKMERRSWACICYLLFLDFVCKVTSHFKLLNFPHHDAAHTELWAKINPFSLEFVRAFTTATDE